MRLFAFQYASTLLNLYCLESLLLLRRFARKHGQDHCPRMEKSTSVWRASLTNLCAQNLPIAFISSIQKRVQRWRVSWLRPVRPVLLICSLVQKIWQILPRKCKAFLYSACNSRIQASNHTTLCEIILSQKKKKPFWCVQELQPLWTCIKETVPRSFVLWYRWDVHILQQEKKNKLIALLTFSYSSFVC